MSLETVKAGFEGIVKRIAGDVDIVARLYELGFLPGERITVRNKTLFGGPLVVEVRGTSVALRRNEALCIKV
jgi:ferrous iron transport protein A